MEEDLGEAVERAQNDHDARAEEAEDVPANRDSQRMANVDHLLATCTEPTAAANNILQRLMERAADESENIIEYEQHPCVKRRQRILDVLARPVEPEEMRYTRRSIFLTRENQEIVKLMNLFDVVSKDLLNTPGI
ncbi:hypothetical protein TSAR_011591 [Trichomalopsis sarcophagae]|uniref:Uncharacterized protein n=1 Tax=Trichomalopsis sarcophagae TaxID=543379 RepID=A0A232ENU8_9HYME|nr:hypothetical protein TSAR_011591 [Trichomalopsis sarcophagae]